MNFRWTVGVKLGVLAGRPEGAERPRAVAPHEAVRRFGEAVAAHDLHVEAALDLLLALLGGRRARVAAAQRIVVSGDSAVNGW